MVKKLCFENANPNTFGVVHFAPKLNTLMVMTSAPGLFVCLVWQPCGLDNTLSAISGSCLPACLGGELVGEVRLASSEGAFRRERLLRNLQTTIK